MGQLFSNNGKTTLANSVDTITTSIVVVDASKFPVITGGNTFKATLENLNRTAVEIIEVTQVVGNTLTVVRAQEGTVATAFDAGSFVEGRLTAGWLNDAGTKLGTVSATELGYLNGVTSGIQGQIDGKESTITTLAVSKGGTGVSTLTGLVKGNGTSAMTAAVAGTDYVIPSGSITGNAATATTLQTARTINGVSFNGSADITIADSTKIPTTEKGTANGVATLGSDGKVPSTQLPSYVDDVLEFTNLAGFPATGESGKIYVALDTNKTYRWSGTAYIYITSGAVDSVAGKTGVVTLVKADVGLVNVDNTSDADKPISTATQTALDAKLASASYTASDVLAKIKTVDGDGSGLDADLLDGIDSTGFVQRKHLGGIGDYVISVIPLVDLTNTDSQSQSFFSGRIHLNRPNGIYSGMFADVVMQKKYNSTDLMANIFEVGNEFLTPVTFTYNGVKYGGVKILPANAQVYDNIYIDGLWRGVSPLLQRLDYYHSQTSTVLNADINGSITETGIDIGNRIYANGGTVWHQGNDGSGSGLDADMLDGQQGSWYAPKDSPDFTGTPTTTTPTTGDSSTRIASTAYVNAEIANDAVTKTSNTGAAALPAGTVAQRPTGINGLIRYNSDFDQFEGFKSGSWSGLGGATGGAGNPAFYENDTAIIVGYTISTGKNAMSAGPISINDGVTVTIPDGSTWTVV